MTAPASKRANVAGIVGLSMVAAATILSPTGFLGITLPFLILLGFGGLAVCGVSLAWRPRWPGVAGLAMGTLCVAAWIGFFGWAFIHVSNSASALGLNVAQHVQVSMSAQVLAEAAESQRAPSGSAPATVVLSGIAAADRTDPWGRPYRYAATSTPRGYTFMSDGPDGIPGTADDIDIFTIQRFGASPLPPISRKIATTVPSGAGAGAPGGSGSGAP